MMGHRPPTPPAQACDSATSATIGLSTRGKAPATVSVLAPALCLQLAPGGPYPYQMGRAV